MCNYCSAHDIDIAAPSLFDLTANDRMTCPACHREMEPEYRVDRHAHAAVQIRARCAGCGRLWHGLLTEPRFEKVAL